MESAWPQCLLPDRWQRDTDRIPTRVYSLALAANLGIFPRLHVWMKKRTSSHFETKLLRPAKTSPEETWTFLVLPKAASDALPRRGRTTAIGTLNGHAFRSTVEPDGQRSHWMKVDEALRKSAGAEPDETVEVEIAPAESEDEPPLPSDFERALSDHPDARTTWDATTTLARIDWIHWLESAKQQKTRDKRITDACEMLAAGKKRVCCFDNSGYYSKSLSAPEAK